MITFVPYEPEHYIEISKDNTEGPSGFIDENSAKFHSVAPATTALNDGEPVACFGLTPLWNGVSELWARFSRPWAEKHPITLARGANFWLMDRMKDHHRVQCYVVASNKKAVKFAEVIGFTEKYLLQSYGPNGEDFYLFSRVR